ncbi:MAG TPA: DUF5335 family protein [Longimicrobium sp.]|nr:DUF5335 family protein [Longimicrobium sp.]
MLPQDDSAGWTALLRAFTNRNLGRLTRLEIDDPAIGAQWQEHGLPLQGVVYEPGDGTVEIFVGTAEGPRLSHRVAGVRAVDVQEDRGRDTLLRLAHEGGQTLLLLVA